MGFLSLLSILFSVYPCQEKSCCRIAEPPGSETTCDVDWGGGGVREKDGDNGSENQSTICGSFYPLVCYITYLQALQNLCVRSILFIGVSCLLWSVGWEASVGSASVRVYFRRNPSSNDTHVYTVSI